MKGKPVSHTRIRILVVMALLLIGIAGLVHTALEQSAAHAAPSQQVAVEPALQAVQVDAAAGVEVSHTTAQSGRANTSGAPGRPIRPVPPATPAASVDPTIWMALTLACFAPFVLAGWYLDRRARPTVSEHPEP